jgi:hypothetical protein
MHHTFIVTFLLFLYVDPSKADPLSVKRVRIEIQQILREEPYQTQFRDAPSEIVVPPTPTQTPTKARPASAAAPSPVSEVSWVILWVLIGVLVLVLVLWLVQEYLRTRQSKLTAQINDYDAVAPKRQTPATSLLAPESLAQQGLFAEAIHALLLLTLNRISQRRSSLESSSTSRELLQERELFAETYHEITLLVDVVERSRFGGRSVHQADFDSCLVAYRLLETKLP